MSIFDRWFKRPTAKEVAQEIVGMTAVKVAEIIPTWREGKPLEPATNFNQLVKDGWRRNELIFACSSRRSNTTSQVALKVYNKRAGTELPDHSLRVLLSHPNKRMSEFDFLSSISVFQDFAGVSYFEKIRSNAGKVVQLYPMRPDWVRPIPSSVNFISGYEYGPPGGNRDFLPPENVLCFPLFDPIDMYKGWPPVAVAARVGDLDNSVTDYIRLMFQEGGVPPGLLKTKQAIDESIADGMRARWKSRYGGYGNWLEPAVLGYDLEYQQVGLGLEAMGLEILDKRSETRICMVMKVPPTVIGTLVGLERAILSNAVEFQKDWWINDLIPWYKSLNDNFNNQLVPDFGGDIEVKWDFNEVPALVDLHKNQKAYALDAFSRGAITRNQYLELVGLPDLGPRGEVYVMSASMVEVPANKILVKPTPVIVAPAKPAAEDEDETEDLTAENSDQTTEEDGTPKPKKTKVITSSDVAVPAPDNEQRLTMERKITKVMTKFFEGELERIIKKVA